MQSKKVALKDTGKIGKGLIAIKDIKKGEIIADWTGGKIYVAERVSLLPKDIADHAIQFDEHQWIDTNGIGRYLNHSCEPNCGIKKKFKVVAMRTIKAGEWVTWDYDMTEDSDWRMKCKCHTASCRKTIGAYQNMPEKTRKKYKGFISTWLIKKYKKNALKRPKTS